MEAEESMVRSSCISLHFVVVIVVGTSHLYMMSYCPPETIYIDTNYSEKNGEFFVHHILNMPSATGEEFIDILKITMPPLIDLLDFKNWSAQVLPHYLLHDCVKQPHIPARRESCSCFPKASHVTTS